MIVYPCNPLSEIAEMVEEILGMANPSICGIANAPDPALLKLRKLMWINNLFIKLTLVTLIYGHWKKHQKNTTSGWINMFAL